MEGSSRIYSTPMRLDPIWVASLIRWLSPPERVAADRLRVRYCSPTLCRNPSRERISFNIWSAIMVWVLVRVSPSMNRRASDTGRVVKSWMLLPPTVTARLSIFSRLPLHTGQGHWLMASSSSRREASDWVSR